MHLVTRRIFRQWLAALLVGAWAIVGRLALEGELLAQKSVLEGWICFGASASKAALKRRTPKTWGWVAGLLAWRTWARALFV